MDASTVVMDVGSASAKVGWAGEDCPLALPSVTDAAIVRPSSGARMQVSNNGYTAAAVV